MPLAWVEHEGQRIDIDEVLAGKSEALLEAFPLSYLASVLEDREWTGTPSVTQLIAGTREAYLKITEDYGVEPAERAFAVLGTRVHYRLEKHATAVGLTPELRLTLPIGVSGMRDLVEPYQGAERLVDYKVIGAYRVKLLLDADRTQTAEERRENWWDYGIQLNAYRIMAQGEAISLHPRRPVWLFGIVRDGGTANARRAIGEAKTFFIPGPVWPDDDVVSWLDERRRKLMDALEQKRLPPLCNEHESWSGRKCGLAGSKGYCDVRHICKRLPGWE